IRLLIMQMNREEHTTIFLTSHDVGDIEKLCRRIIIVNAGQIVLDDSVEHLKRRYPDKRAEKMQTFESPAGHVEPSAIPLEEIIMEIYKSEGRDVSP
ncbi:MAG: ABC transporter, partial [Lachnospiraceae bacterium]|nr:ABC transporter [Lachnospiraceae bacterium]